MANAAVERFFLSRGILKMQTKLCYFEQRWFDSENIDKDDQLHEQKNVLR